MIDGVLIVVLHSLNNRWLKVQGSQFVKGKSHSRKCGSSSDGYARAKASSSGNLWAVVLSFSKQTLRTSNKPPTRFRIQHELSELLQTSYMHSSCQNRLSNILQSSYTCSCCQNGICNCRWDTKAGSGCLVGTTYTTLIIVLIVENTPSYIKWTWVKLELEPQTTQCVCVFALLWLSGYSASRVWMQTYFQSAFPTATASNHPSKLQICLM